MQSTTVAKRITMLTFLMLFPALPVLSTGKGTGKGVAIQNTKNNQHKSLPAIPEYVANLLDLEIAGNQFFERKRVAAERKRLLDQQTVSMEHYEVPLRLVNIEWDFLTTEERRALVFTKNGEQYLRWIKNPDDRIYYKEVENWLISKKLDSTPKRYFTGYRTSSRSFFIQDPEKPEVVFNVKVSTDDTGGPYKDKKIDAPFATNEKVIDDYVLKSTYRKNLSSLQLLPERGIYYLQDIDQGMLVRSIPGKLRKKNTHMYFLLPGFSVVHQDIGKLVPMLITNNNEINTALFWEKHMVIPYAYAMAEFFAHTGTIPSSAHSQNFYLQLSTANNGNKHRSQIILKDFGDVYYVLEMVKGADMRKYLEAFSLEDLQESGSENRFLEEITIPFKIMQEMEYPSWLNDESYSSWRETFFSSFEKKFFKLTGIKLVPRIDIAAGRDYYNWNLFKGTEIEGCFAKYQQPKKNAGANANTRVRTNANYGTLKGKSCKQLLDCTYRTVTTLNIDPPLDTMKFTLIEKGELPADKLNVTQKQMDNYYQAVYQAFRYASESCWNSVRTTPNI
ncbi:MAG: hypothetical protein HQK53_06535 [Oligoflexia bacterium]|nr:hypothetical protein [Oligoflexia bacterium]